MFAESYDEALCNFFPFVQTTVYGADVGSAKEATLFGHKEHALQIQLYYDFETANPLGSKKGIHKLVFSATVLEFSATYLIVVNFAYRTKS